MGENGDLVDFAIRIEVARRARWQLSDRVKAATGLTLNQCLVLSEIEHANGRATVTSLATSLSRAVHTLTTAVTGLERKGLAVRSSLSGEDRRITRIAITSKGARALEQFRSSAAQIVENANPLRLGEAPEDAKRSCEALVRLLQQPTAAPVNGRSTAT